MAVYNTTAMDNITSILQMVTHVGSVMGDDFLIGYLILASVFIIFLIASFRYDIKQVLVVDSFVCTIVSILLYGATMLPITVIVIPVVLFVFSLIIYYITG